MDPNSPTEPSFTYAEPSFFSPLISTFTSLLTLLESIFFKLGVHPGYIIWRTRLLINTLSSRVGLAPRGHGRETEYTANEDEPEGYEMAGLAMLVNGGAGGRKRRPEGALRRRAKIEQTDELPIREGAAFPGMVNLSGTLCYMNSVLQSFASMRYLGDHLDAVLELAGELDMETPVTDGLSLALEELNTPSTSHRPTALRPYQLVESLSTLPSVRRLLSTREHQDAHELFLLLANAVGDELGKLDAERRRDRGLPVALGFRRPIPGGFGAGSELASEPPTREGTPLLQGSGTGLSWRHKEKGKEKERIISPWEGLSANRRSCIKCGWCEAIRYETVGALDVAVPLRGRIELERCLDHFTKIESLEAYCDACTVRLTHNYYTVEAQRLSQPDPENPDAPIPPSRKKRARDARRMEKRLQELIDAEDYGDLETKSGLEAVKWVKAMTPNSKQSMIARPPPVLCLHLVRSEWTFHGQIKKTPMIDFPSILDMTPFCTSAVLRKDGQGPISGKSERETAGWVKQGGRSQVKKEDNDDFKPQEEEGKPPKVLYRLDAVICHYGFTHSFGHFVAYRRIPSSVLGPETPRKACPDYCECDACDFFGPVRGPNSAPGKGWLRISDADVEEIGESDVLSEKGSAFLLFYERVLEYEGDKEPVMRGSRPSVIEALRSQQAGAVEPAMHDPLGLE